MTINGQNLSSLAAGLRPSRFSPRAKYALAAATCLKFGGLIFWLIIRG
ncbi:MAG: hypothetical protein WCT37_05455 [Patescibacteria group bacterium]